MKIDCYLSSGCGAEEALRVHIKKALARQDVEATVNFKTITDAQAVELGLRGSPSVFVDGVDIEPAEVVGFA